MIRQRVGEVPRTLFVYHPFMVVGISGGKMFKPGDEVEVMDMEGVWHKTIVSSVNTNRDNETVYWVKRGDWGVNSLPFPGANKGNTDVAHSKFIRLYPLTHTGDMFNTEVREA
jgi:hypothetical protein